MSAPHTEHPTGPTRSTRWDPCTDCGHRRDDHDGAGCAVDIVRAGYPTPCPCLDFIPAAEATDG